MEPYFSILIPVCNQEGKMDGCFDSLYNQTFKDFEIIFVDDGSTDNSLNLLKEYAKKDSRARIIEHKENKSLLYARWTAMGDAKGKYVIFLDSDDALTYDACEKLHKHFETTGDDVVRFGYKWKNKNVDTIPLEYDDMLKVYFTGIVPPAIWKNAYSIDVIRKSHDTMEPFYCNMAEDSFYATVFFSNAKKVGIMKDVLYLYTDDNGMSSSIKSLSYEKFLKDMDYIELIIDKIGKYIEKNKKDYINYLDKNKMMLYISVAAKYVLFDKSKENEKLYIEYLKKDAKYNTTISFINEQILPCKEY